MRIVFMGSSAASSVCLHGLMREDGLDVVGLVTQPDRPAGRGKAITPCHCKAYAESIGIKEIITPENVNDPDVIDKIASWKPDAVVVVAFGQFLGKRILSLPRFGCINCHFSILPKYRGASPVASAIAAGEKLTGVTVMRMDEGMDSGPMILQSYEPIYSDVTTGEMTESLSFSGGVTLAKALKRMASGDPLPEIPQDPAGATYAGKLKKTDGRIDWNEPVIVIERKIRAYIPWPGSYTFLPERFRKKGSEGRVAVGAAEIVSDLEPGWRDAAPGTVLKTVRSVPKDARRDASGREIKTGVVVKCGDTALKIVKFKPEGASFMDGASFLAGRPLVPFEDKFL